MGLRDLKVLVCPADKNTLWPQILRNQSYVIIYEVTTKVNRKSVGKFKLSKEDTK